MAKTRIRSFRFAVVCTLVLGLGMAALPAHTRAQGCLPAWTVVASPNGSSDDNVLNDVAVIGANDIWAVGTTGTGLNPLNTLTEHWNGSSWSVVSSPNGVFTANFLSSVHGIASNDVWAVGYSDNGSVSNNQSRTLILHWDGSAWSVVTSPNTTRPVNRLHGVAAISANDVWAVGTSYNYSVYRTLIMHWDGASWTIVTSPNPGSSANFLYGIDAVSASDVWAVGTQQDFLEQTLVVHWNGASWTVVESPQIGPYGNNMLQVHARTASDIWAVGYHLTVFGFSQPFQTSTFHYDGTSWSAVTSPNVNQNHNYLFDVVGLADNDAWAVGFYDTGTALNTMVQHWDGTSWTIGTSPNPRAYTNELIGLDAVSATDIWAVGRTTDGLIGVDTLVERYSSGCPATPTSTPTAVRTPTPTTTPPTATPSRTPTPSSSALHVAGIAPAFRARSGSYQVRATITIQDGNNVAVSGAAVTVNITLPDSRIVVRSGTTNSTGQTSASVTSALTGTYTFTVTNVTKSGFTYDSSANVETSDSILVSE